MIQIIAISGKAESGKTYTANILKDLIPNSTILPLASSLKEIAKQAGWNGVKDEAGRTFLQKLAGIIKEYKGLGFFAEKLVEYAGTLKYADTIIVDDLRMPEELAVFETFCAENPNVYLTTIRVERPCFENSLTPEQRADRSETGLDDAKFKYTLVNHGDKAYKTQVEIFHDAHIKSMSQIRRESLSEK